MNKLKKSKTNVGTDNHGCPLHKMENKHVGADASVRPLKTNHAITLIALILTIIVLLILAVVAIRAVQGDGIIQHAKKAKSEYEESKQKEEEQLMKYEYELAKATGKTNESYTQYVLDKKYPGMKIGDYVNYDELSNGEKEHTPDTTKGAGTKNAGGGGLDTPVVLDTGKIYTEDLSWRVLGINPKGELELISDKPTDTKLFLANKEGYQYAVTTYNTDGTIKEEGTLDKFCNELYGKGTNASEARSLNVEDVNKLTGYNPETARYKAGGPIEYGTKYTYYWDGNDSPYYEARNGKTGEIVSGEYGNGHLRKPTRSVSLV